MAAIVQEFYTAVPLAASGVVAGAPAQLGGFFCTTAGSLQLRNGITVAGNILVATFACNVGQYYPLPFNFPAGLYAEITGGCVGTFGVS